MLEIFLWICIAVAGLLLLDRLFLRMEERGWLYYRKKKPKSGWGDVFTGSNVFDPNSQNLYEARQQKADQEDEDNGDDDDKRQDADRVT